MSLNDDMGDGDKRIIRQAMLEAEAHWLDEAESAATPTLRTLAVVMADAFSQEAEKYKVVNREGWATDDVSSIGTDGNDESRTPRALPEDGGGRGGESLSQG